MKENVFSSLFSLTILLALFSSIGGHSDTSYSQEAILTAAELETRYGVKSTELRFTPKNGFPILLRGVDESTFIPTLDNQLPEIDPTPYDVVIVGGGPAGLTSAVYLSDWGKKVLVLERESQMGGLAAGGEKNGIRYGRGAAYLSPPSDAEDRIFHHIGLKKYKKQLKIHEPIDSYLWNGKLYVDVWEQETLHELPASFELFKYALDEIEEIIPDQPMEKTYELWLDRVRANDFIRQIPVMVAKMENREASELYDRFMNDPKVNRLDPMKDVLDFVDLYCRSALGTTSDQVSALAFTNFYVAEFYTRYTGEYGTGDVATAFLEKLGNRPEVKLETDAIVARITNTGEDVKVTFLKNGKRVQVSAHYVVFAAPLNLAPQLINGFATQAPKHNSIIQKMKFLHYSVHNVFVKGHPWRDTYDLWMRPANYTEEFPSDVIIGRWQDPAINGFQGMRDFNSKELPPDDYGVLTVYQPLSLEMIGTGYTDSQAVQLAEDAVLRTKEMLAPLLQEKYGTQIQIELIETTRWPYSIHLAAPGHIGNTNALSQPVGRIYFASNNLGVPSFEEALFRGKQAAKKILKRIEQSQELRPFPRGKNPHPP